MQRVVYTILIVTGLIIVEVVFIAMSTGYMLVHVKSSLLENAGFFMVLLQEEPLMTLKLMLIEKPLFIIEARHEATASVVWSLHYFSFTLLVHFIISFFIAGIILRFGEDLRWQDIPFTGSVLLLFASLYLLMTSCCTAGPNWIFHTWLLSVVFNPITSSNATIKVYQFLKDGFVLLQIGTGLVGGYLLWRHPAKTA